MSGIIASNVQTVVPIENVSFTIATNLSGNLQGKAYALLGVAQPGTLSTRTSNTAGTLTMTNSGHGITTGSLLDIYWTGGRCYQALVGSVSGTSVPFTLAQGTSLPIATTAINAQIPTALNFSVPSNINLQTVVMQCDYESQFTYYETGLAIVDWNQYLLPANSGTQSAAGWISGLGTQPFPISGACAAPVQSAAALASGGTLVDATPYYWVITATNANGQTTVSNQQTLTPASTNQTGTLTWAAVTNATGYKIYRSTTTNSYGASSLVTTITNPATLTYNDTGSATTTGTPPSVNGAVANIMTTVYISHSDPNNSHYATAAYLSN